MGSGGGGSGRVPGEANTQRLRLDGQLDVGRTAQLTVELDGHGRGRSNRYAACFQLLDCSFALEGTRIEFRQLYQHFDAAHCPKQRNVEQTVAVLEEVLVEKFRV